MSFGQAHSGTTRPSIRSFVQNLMQRFQSTSSASPPLKITENPKTRTGIGDGFNPIGMGMNAAIYEREGTDMVISSPRTSFEVEGFGSKEDQSVSSLTEGISPHVIEAKEFLKITMSNILQELDVPNIALLDSIAIGDDHKPRTEMLKYNGGSVRDRIAAGECEETKYDIMLSLLDTYDDLDNKSFIHQDQSAGNILIDIAKDSGKTRHIPYAHDLDDWNITQYSDVTKPNSDDETDAYKLLMRHKSLYESALQIQSGTDPKNLHLNKNELNFCKELSKAHPDTIKAAIKLLDERVVSNKWVHRSLSNSSIIQTCKLISELFGAEEFNSLIVKFSEHPDIASPIKKEDIPSLAEDSLFFQFFKNTFQRSPHTTKRTNIFRSEVRKHCLQKKAEQEWSNNHKTEGSLFSQFFKNIFQKSPHTTKRINIFKPKVRKYCLQKKAEQEWNSHHKTTDISPEVE